MRYVTELLAAMRAAAWESEPEEPPGKGTEARGEIYVLARVPLSLLSALPQG
jgi:hypothetical protein